MAKTATILIVDDHRAIREELAFALDYDGFATCEAADGPACLELVEKRKDIGLVLLDVKLPGLDGLEVLTKLKDSRPELPVVMISGHGDLDTAVLAVRKGAYDFLQKPFATDRVLLSIKNAMAAARLEHENVELRAALSSDLQLLGESDAIEQVRAMVRKVAPTDVPVLITGENGTGKELVARQLHASSRRSQGAFIAINCAAIPADLAESELFGHEKGAFTGAIASRPGAFEQADGGTLFLDEVGDLPLPMQAKLLRALQEQTVQRLGSQRTVAIDVRILASTNQDLDAMVAEKTFREDLFYRLHVVRVHLPPLRERHGDIERLGAHFLKVACNKNGITRRKLVGPATGWLASQPWPGNVRQLKNVIEAAAILTDGEEVGIQDLEAVAVPPPTRGPAGDTDWFQFERLEDFRGATEKEFLRRKLLENNGNIKRTAERIKLMRSNLYKKLARYDLK